MKAGQPWYGGGTHLEIEKPSDIITPRIHSTRFFFVHISLPAQRDVHRIQDIGTAVADALTTRPMCFPSMALP